MGRDTRREDVAVLRWERSVFHWADFPFRGRHSGFRVPIFFQWMRPRRSNSASTPAVVTQSRRTRTRHSRA